jgi:chromosomal replication initiation ATPase DnaA
MSLKNNGEKPLVSPKNIIRLVEDEYGVKVTLRSRKHEIIFPRHQCIYLLRKYAKLSLNGICEYFPITDHTTIINSLKKNRNMMETEIEYYTRLKKLDDEIAEYINNKGGDSDKYNILSSH